jgi:hypothetical protein
MPGAPLSLLEREEIRRFGFQRGVIMASSNQLGLPA